MKPTIKVAAGDVRRGDSVLANFRWHKASQVWVKGNMVALTFGRNGSIELPVDRMISVRR